MNMSFEKERDNLSRLRLSAIESGRTDVAEAYERAIWGLSSIEKHLSAQAKVQLPDDVEEVTVSLGDDAAYLRMENNGESEIADNMERAAELIESFAARLSRGAQSSGNSGEVAQGEAVAEIEYIDDDGVTVKWFKEVFRGDRLYTHPAERAVVPDGEIAKAARMIRGSVIRRLDECHKKFPDNWCSYLDDACGAAEVIAEKLEALSAAPTLAGKGGA
jgi:hypothetical protein